MTQAQAAAGPKSRLHPSKKGYKACAACRRWHPPTEYEADANSPDELGRVCAGCRKKVEAEKAKRQQLTAAIVAQVEADKVGDDLIVALFKAGLSPEDVALKVGGITPADVLESVALHKAKNIDTLTREVLRQKALIKYDDIYQRCLDRGDLKEARLSIGDQLKAVGIIQQGGNTMKFEFNQTNNVLEERLDAWSRKEGILEGEVVEGGDNPQLPPAAADT